MSTAKRTPMHWCCDTPSFMKELIENSSDRSAIAMPLKIFYSILGSVAARAQELNDPKLNFLMCRLTLYTISDQTSPDYNPKWRELIQETIDNYERLKE